MDVVDELVPDDELAPELALPESVLEVEVLESVFVLEPLESPLESELLLLDSELLELDALEPPRLSVT